MFGNLSYTFFTSQIADNSHLSNEDELLKSLISEENERDSFTAVVITGINQAHIPYLKNCHEEWTRQLKQVFLVQM